MSELVAGVEAAAGLAVYGAAAVDFSPAASVRRALVAADVPRSLAAKDPTLWGSEAEPVAKSRLGWLDAHRSSRDLLPLLAELRAELGDLDNVVLAGMGGSALAAEVITRTLGVRLVVLDSTDPHQVRAAIFGRSTDPWRRRDRLRRTVVVLASKSGCTIETDSHRRAFLDAFRDLGLPEAEVGRHFVVVTDPGSPLVATAGEMGAFVVLADPDVTGRYAALTAFGLVPAALAGVDVAELLDQAESLAPSLAGEADNPALALGAALSAAAIGGRDKIALLPDGAGTEGFGDWAEQLIAESTGKDGVGLLPVVVEDPMTFGRVGPDVLTVTYGGTLLPGAWPGGGIRPDVAVNGPLGAQLLAWEYAVAIVGRVLGVNPFDQPNVTEAKDNTAALLDTGLPDEAPTFVDGAVHVHTTGAEKNLPDVLRALLTGLGDDGYLAVTAYLDRYSDADLLRIRQLLARVTGRPVTFGWGPRHLHSTGQYHKGGPQVGSFLQITGAVVGDLAVPGRPYTFGELQATQAAADRLALAARDRPVVRLHLSDRIEGVRQILAVADSLRSRPSP